MPWNENSWGMAYWATWIGTRPRTSDGPLTTGSLLSPMLRMEVGDSHSSSRHISPPLPIWKFETIEHPCRRSRGKKHFKEFASLYYGSYLDWPGCVSIDFRKPMMDFMTSQFWEPHVNNKVWYEKLRKMTQNKKCLHVAFNMAVKHYLPRPGHTDYDLRLFVGHYCRPAEGSAFWVEPRHWESLRHQAHVSLASLNTCSFGSRLPKKLHVEEDLEIVGIKSGGSEKIRTDMYFYWKNWNRMESNSGLQMWKQKCIAIYCYESWYFFQSLHFFQRAFVGNVLGMADPTKLPADLRPIWEIVSQERGPERFCLVVR